MDNDSDPKPGELSERNYATHTAKEWNSQTIHRPELLRQIMLRGQKRWYLKKCNVPGLKDMIIRHDHAV